MSCVLIFQIKKNCCKIKYQVYEDLLFFSLCRDFTSFDCSTIHRLNLSVDALWFLDFFPDLFSLLLNYISKKSLMYKKEQNISYKDWEEGMHICIITHRIKSFKQNVLNTCSLVMLFYLCNIIAWICRYRFSPYGYIYICLPCTCSVIDSSLLIPDKKLCVQFSKELKKKILILTENLEVL